MLLALSTGKEIGLGLVALVFIGFALLSSFVFPRMNPNYPGKRVGIFVVIVVLLAIAQLAAVENFGAESKAAGKGGGTTTTQAPNGNPSVTPKGNPTAGKAVFSSAGCVACHTLKEANATGTVGPNLDTALKGKNAAFIKQSIVDPNAYIAPGYPKGVMPQDFGKSLSSTQIDDLVALLYSAANGGTGGGTSSSTTTSAAAAPAGDASVGKAAFTSAGCTACHTLKEANATGTVGPNLDTALKGKDAAFIKQSIVDPNAYIAPGYPKGVMPQNFGTSLSSKQIAGLVALLYKASHS